MALFEIPEDILVKDAESSEVVELCTINDTGALGHIRVYLLAEVLTGNEQIYLELRESDGTTVRGTSNTITLSDIENFDTTAWLGWVRFDFNKENLDTGLRLFAITSNYTYVEDTNSLSYVLSYKNPTYTTDFVNLSRPKIDIQIFKYE